MARLRMCLLGFILIFLLPLSVSAQTDVPAQWSVAAKLKRLINSHTSFEFGNPLPPGQVPLSRLEFPLDSWWGGIGVSRTSSLWSFNLEVLSNLCGEADGMMKDSDWENGNLPRIKTTYSESGCRIDPSYQALADVDLQVGEWLNLPAWISLAPLVGVRYHYFDLVAHDTTQWDLTGVTPTIYLAGDTLTFEQTYWQYLLGLRCRFDLGPKKGLPLLELKAQVDWAYVDAHNEDHHLLRGDRITLEDTTGDAWHGTLGLRAGLGPDWTLGMEAEYLRIRTKGSHCLLYNSRGIDYTWDNGVSVWSDQKSVFLSLEYLF